MISGGRWAAGVLLSLLGFAGKVERDERMPGEDPPHEAGLARLASAGEHQHRPLARQPA
jgi:hypothetical protein